MFGSLFSKNTVQNKVQEGKEEQGLVTKVVNTFKGLMTGIVDSAKEGYNSSKKVMKGAALTGFAAASAFAGGMTAGDEVQAKQAHVAPKPKTATTAKTQVQPKTAEMHVGSSKITWMNNNTKWKADGNERRMLQGIDAQGNLIISARGLTNTGSYAGKKNVHAKDALKQGQLSLLLYVDGFESAVKLPFPTNGVMTIHKDSPEFQKFFTSHGEFKGHMMQLARVQSTGNVEAIASSWGLGQKLASTVSQKTTQQVKKTAVHPTTVPHKVSTTTKTQNIAKQGVSTPKTSQVRTHTTVPTLTTTKNFSTPKPVSQKIIRQSAAPKVFSAPTPIMPTPVFPPSMGFDGVNERPLKPENIVREPRPTTHTVPMIHKEESIPMPTFMKYLNTFSPTPAVVLPTPVAQMKPHVSKTISEKVDSHDHNEHHRSNDEVLFWLTIIGCAIGGSILMGVHVREEKAKEEKALSEGKTIVVEAEVLPSEDEVTAERTEIVDDTLPSEEILKTSETFMNDLFALHARNVEEMYKKLSTPEAIEASLKEMNNDEEYISLSDRLSILEQKRIAYDTFVQQYENVRLAYLTLDERTSIINKVASVLPYTPMMHDEEKMALEAKLTFEYTVELMNNREVMEAEDDHMFIVQTHDESQGTDIHIEDPVTVVAEEQVNTIQHNSVKERIEKEKELIAMTRFTKEEQEWINTMVAQETPAWHANVAHEQEVQDQLRHQYSYEAIAKRFEANQHDIPHVETIVDVTNSVIEPSIEPTTMPLFYPEEMEEILSYGETLPQVPGLPVGTDAEDAIVLDPLTAEDEARVKALIMEQEENTKNSEQNVELSPTSIDSMLNAVLPDESHNDQQAIEDQSTVDIQPVIQDWKNIFMSKEQAQFALDFAEQYAYAPEHKFGDNMYISSVKKEFGSNKETFAAYIESGNQLLTYRVEKSEEGIWDSKVLLSQDGQGRFVTFSHMPNEIKELLGNV